MTTFYPFKTFIKSPVASGLFIFPLILCLLGGCWLRPDSSQKSVLVVNNRPLILKDFSALLARRLRGYDALKAKDPVTVDLAKEAVIKNFILDSLILETAAAEKITVSDAELDSEINSFRANYPDDISFRNVLAQEGISFADWKDKLKLTLINKKVFAKIAENSKPVTDEEARIYYDSNKDQFKKKDRIYLRQIVLDDLEKATAVREELKKTKNFAEMAKKYSVAPEAKEGGLVGWVEQGSVDIFNKAFNLPVDGLSPVLESTYGFHIFKVERKAKAGIASFDEEKPFILTTLRAQKEQAEFAKWLDKKIRSAHVYKDTNLLNGLRIETRGD